MLSACHYAQIMLGIIDTSLLTFAFAMQMFADHVIVSVGIDANSDLAESAGLEVDPQLGGYRVNAELGAASNIWVVRTTTVLFSPNNRVASCLLFIVSSMN